MISSLYRIPPIMSSIELQTLDKLTALKELLKPALQQGLLVAFSGGLDSAFLLWCAEETRREHGGRLLALTTFSPSMPLRDLEDARGFASAIGVEHRIVESKEFGQERYLQNDLMRCYYCKTELFAISREIIDEQNCSFIAYGYNASDFGDHRPGHRAAMENNILAPLADVEFNKEAMRLHLREHSKYLSEKPASPCLSSRVMTGVRIDAGMLGDIDALETLLREGGLRIFRVRLHEQEGNRFLRLEVVQSEMDQAMKLRQEFVDEAKKRGYRWITIDLEGYRMGGANLS